MLKVIANVIINNIQFLILYNIGKSFREIGNFKKFLMIQN